MGKDGGPMTAKAIAKKIKAKGLGRLRWYCQMCEKQCRDENGFQCHIRSESHKRQLAVFAESPNEFISGFSDKFRRDFLKALKQRYGTTFVLANNAYQEYIKDRHHLHMNATRWTTLSAFVEELGRTSRCIVENRDSGYWIKLVDQDAAARAEMARADDRRRADELHRSDERLLSQMRAAAVNAHAFDDSDDEPQPNTAALFQEPVKLQVRNVGRPSKSEVGVWANVFAGDVKENDGVNNVGSSASGLRKKKNQTKKVSALESIISSKPGSSSNQDTSKRAQFGRNTVAVVNEERRIEEAVPQNQEDEDLAWLVKGIEVSVQNKEVGSGKFFGKKGCVVDVIEEYGAKVRFIEGNVLLQLDQDDLESVVPKSDTSVILLAGKHRGRRAEITAWDDKKNSAVVALEGSGELLRCNYKYISKVA